MDHHSHKAKTVLSAYERNIGIVMLIFLAFIIGVFSYYFFKKGKINKPFYLYTIVDSGLGIDKNMKVLINGIECGFVEETQIIREASRNNGKIKIKMIIDKDYSDLVKENAKAVFMSASLMGDLVVNIMNDTDVYEEIKSEKQVSENTILPSVVDKGLGGITEKLDPVIDTLKASTMRIKSITDNLTSTTVEIRKLVISTNQITESINNKEGTVGMLIKDKELYDKIDKTILELQALLETFNGLDKIKDQISSVAGNADAMITDTRSTIKNIDNNVGDILKTYEDIGNRLSGVVNDELKKMVGTAVELINNLSRLTKSVTESTDEMPEVLRQTKESMLQADMLIEALKKHWLLKKYFTVDRAEDVIQYEER